MLHGNVALVYSRAIFISPSLEQINIKQRYV